MDQSKINYKLVKLDDIKTSYTWILLVTATEIETEEMHRNLKPLPDYDSVAQIFEGNYTYYAGILGLYPVIHVQSEMGSLSRGASILTTSEAIDKWNAKAVIMPGIAFGIKKDEQNIGDVLISKTIIAYNIQRVGEKETIHRNPDPQSGQILFNRFTEIKNWNHKLQNDQAARRIIGPILSGESLVDNIKYRDKLLKDFPNAKGGEMEGAGLYAATNSKKKEWLVVKGICDFADGNKSKDKEKNQEIAIKSAMSLVITVFKQEDIFNGLGIKSINNNPLFENISKNTSRSQVNSQSDTKANHLVEKITPEIKKFMVAKFNSNPVIDDLCSELEIDNTFNSVDRKEVIRLIIVEVESNYPEPVKRIYHALYKLKPNFETDIDSLFLKQK